MSDQKFSQYPLGRSLCSEPLMEIEALSYRYPGGRTALDSVNLTIALGARMALTGANGAGKTTLLLHLNGILRPTSGEVRFRGEPVTYSRKALNRLRQAVAVVFQDPEDQLFAGTVYQDVSFGPLNLGVSETEVRRRVDEALTWLDIPQLRDRPVHMLSFGEKKRVAIAGAVAMRPELLVLDEPTGGLDPATSTSLLECLDAIHAAGTTMVIATHDLDLAYEWASEVVIMEGGRIASCGKPTDLFQQRDLLTTCRLRPPLLVEFCEILKELDVLPQDCFPRSLVQLRSMLLQEPRPGPSTAQDLRSRQLR